MTDNLVPFRQQIRDGANRHVVDRLADIRDKIAFFKGIENELKEEIARLMGDKTSLGGDNYIAVKVVSERVGSIDAKALAADGINVDKYRKAPSQTTAIRLEERKVIA